MVLANLAEGLLSTMGRVGDHIGPTEIGAQNFLRRFLSRATFSLWAALVISQRKGFSIFIEGDGRGDDRNSVLLVY
jgi:hypothetical protein